MANNDKSDKSKSRLPVVLKQVEKNFQKAARRNDLIESKRYDAIERCAEDHVKLGTNGVTYVSEHAFPKIFGLPANKAAYVYENQISETDKRDFGGESLAHSSAVVGLLDRKAQEDRRADNQALLQFSRDTLLSISDSPQAQDLRRKCDTFTARELPKLRDARGVRVDELTGDPLGKGAAFHHVNPKELHTDPEDVLNPDKGRNLNVESHKKVHRENLNDEKSFEIYKNEVNKK